MIAKLKARNGDEREEKTVPLQPPFVGERESVFSSFGFSLGGVGVLTSSFGGDCGGFWTVGTSKSVICKKVITRPFTALFTPIERLIVRPEKSAKSTQRFSKRTLLKSGG